MKYSIYLFDFDYTLADSSVGIVTCFQNVLRRHGYLTIREEEIKRTIGKTLEESFSVLTAVTDTDQLLSWKKEYVREADTHMTANTHFFPETIPVLKELKAKGARLGIISTKYRYRIKEMIDTHLPENWFDLIIGGEDVQYPKPHPQGLLLAQERLDATKEQIAYIGDSIIDAETACRAGVDFFGVTTGMTTREELSAYPHQKIDENLYKTLID